MVSDLVGILSNLKISLKLNKFKLPGKLYIHPPETLEEGNGNWRVEMVKIIFYLSNSRKAFYTTHLQLSDLHTTHPYCSKLHLPNNSILGRSTYFSYGQNERIAQTRGKELNFG